MSQLTTLTEEQKQLIQSNITGIKSRIRNRIKNYPILFRYYGHNRQNECIEAALSYVPKAAMAFNPQKCKIKYFDSYVANIALYRLMDYIRGDYLKNKNHCDFDENLSKYNKGKGLYKRYNNNDQNISFEDSDMCNISNNIAKPFYRPENGTMASSIALNYELEEFELKDSKDKIVSEVMKLKCKPKYRNIYVDLLYNYVLPRCTGAESKTLEKIAKEHEVSFLLVSNFLDNIRRVSHKVLQKDGVLSLPNQ